MRGAIPPFPHSAFITYCPIKTQGQLYVYLTYGKIFVYDFAVTESSR
jgi:hypothetical protein